VRALGRFPAGMEAVAAGAIDGKTDWTEALRDVDSASQSVRGNEG